MVKSTSKSSNDPVLRPVHATQQQLRTPSPAAPALTLAALDHYYTAMPAAASAKRAAGEKENVEPVKMMEVRARAPNGRFTQIAIWPQHFATGSNVKVHVGVDMHAPDTHYAVKIAPLTAVSAAAAAEEMRLGQAAADASSPVALFASPSHTIMLMRPVADDLHAVSKKLRSSEHTPETACAVAIAAMVQPMQQLAQLHEKNIVHGDIKPDNVHLRRVGEKTFGSLADFGLSHQKSKDVGAMQHESLPEEGAPEFTPPEAQNEDGERVAATAAGDVWAAGMSMLMMATGEHLFGLQLADLRGGMDRWGNIASLIDGIKTLRAQTGSHGLISNTPAFAPIFAKVEHPDLRHLLAKMLSFDPTERPGAKEVATVLQTMQRQMHASTAARTAQTFLAAQNSLGQKIRPDAAKLQAVMQQAGPTRSPSRQEQVQLTRRAAPSAIPAAAPPSAPTPQELPDMVLPPGMSFLAGSAPAAAAGAAPDRSDAALLWLRPLVK